MRVVPHPTHDPASDTQDRDAWMRGILGDSALSPAAAVIGCRLGLYFDPEVGTCNPSVTALSHATGTASRTVQKAVSQLEARGWIARRQGKGAETTTYWLLLSRLYRDGAEHVRLISSTGETMH